MKVYFRGFATRLPGVKTLEPFYRFALSQHVSTAVIGCDSVEQLEENVTFARSFKPLSDEEMQECIVALSPVRPAAPVLQALTGAQDAELKPAATETCRNDQLPQDRFCVFD
ncbi:MAG: hypothetical protein MZU95_17690 [Desulfomicrobium escambiense]|nr:hypothetical protein [Desulfomicrobium escambiense]